jgi:hypothetical protein
MPNPVVNNVVSTDVLQEVVFTAPRPGFSVVVSNKAIAYQIALPGGSGSAQDIVWESIFHQLNPSFSQFTDPALEGYPGTRFFAGFRFKSWLPGVPAIVSVN